jgi:hypothetical protein
MMAYQNTESYALLSVIDKDIFVPPNDGVSTVTGGQMLHLDALFTVADVVESDRRLKGTQSVGHIMKFARRGICRLRKALNRR